MDWEDTVMSDGKIQAWIDNRFGVPNTVNIQVYRDFAKVQAEISFPKGEEQGWERGIEQGQEAGWEQAEALYQIDTG